MSLGTNSFEFEEFVLDAKERTLLRYSEPVPLTPKAFQLLLVLLENQGRLVKKDELMQAVWADSFVEDGNLTFTIRLLRKALKDSPQKPRFIKTVPLYGYKFIADVKKISDETGFIVEKTGSPAEDFDSIKRESKNSYISIAAIAVVLLIGSIALGGWYLQSKRSEANLPLLSMPFASEKLSTDGKSLHAVISPDGKNVVYTSSLNGKQSVWLRQLETGGNVELISPSGTIYGGLAFSPDGTFLYFSRKPKDSEEQSDIFRISIFGGIPTKIVGDTQGWVDVSPDGTKISFVRCYHVEEEYCSIWIADSADGKNERKLVSRPHPFRIGDSEFSPDGKSIAFAVGQSENQSNEFGLMEVEIESGKERELTSEKFFDIRHLAWLPGKNGLLITASRIPNRSFRVWQVFTETDLVQPLTKDSENYSALSLDENFRLLVSTQFKSDFRLVIFNLGNPAIRQELAEAETAAFSPDGKIVFSSEKSGNMEIWAIEPDGSRQRQLTNNASDDNKPIVSPDNNFIFFASNRTGEVEVWRMNTDGSNQIQITQKDGGFPIFVSPDGSRVYYHHGRNRTLWSVAIKGGDEKLVLDKRKYDFAVSPDSSQVAFSEIQGEERVLTVFSLTENRIIKNFKTAVEKSRILEIEWMPDGKSILYILTDSAFENNSLWSQKLDGEKPERIVDFGNDEMSESSGFAIAPDGKSFTISQGGWRHDAVLLRGLK